MNCNAKQLENKQVIVTDIDALIAHIGRIPAVRPCVGFERWQFGRMVGYALFTAFILFNFSIPLVLFVNKYDLCFIILLEKVF
jgi:hypothetical protein